MDIIGGITSEQLGFILSEMRFKKVRSNELFDYYETFKSGQENRLFDFSTITLPSSKTLLKWGIVNRIMNELFRECASSYLAVFYHFDTIFPAGKYKGKTLNEVIEIDIKYIEDCIFNVDYFFFFERTLPSKYNRIERAFFFNKQKKLFESFSAETIEFYNKKRNDNVIINTYKPDYYGNDRQPEIPNETYDYEDWLRDECGDEAGSAYWNLD